MSTTISAAGSGIASGTGAAAAAGAAAATPDNTANLANKETFLQLLVAQLKYQNPMNPADGVQFLTQLSQFTELEQVIAMRQDMAAVRKALEGPKAIAAAPATTGPGGDNNSTK
jgi:flagellar basal-body rod modification protein FlgD